MKDLIKHDYIKDKYEDVVNYYIKTDKIGKGWYRTYVYPVIDRRHAYPEGYLDIDFKSKKDKKDSFNIFEAFLTHYQLYKKWKSK